MGELEDRISSILGIACTCRASTCKSGSEMVISTPSTKPRVRISGRFLVFVIRAPTCSPMGVMATSAPTEKNIMPTTSKTAPVKKLSSIPLGIGATVRLSASKSTTMGSTAEMASRIFSRSFCFSIKRFPLLSLMRFRLSSSHSHVGDEKRKAEFLPKL